MAKIYKRLASISAITKLRSKGITAQAAKAGAMAKIGAKKNKTLFEAVGRIISLNKSFNASAIG